MNIKLLLYIFFCMPYSLLNAMDTDPAHLAKEEICILMAPLVVKTNNFVKTNNNVYKIELMHKRDQLDIYSTLKNYTAYITMENFYCKRSLFSLTIASPLLKVEWGDMPIPANILELNEKKECVSSKKPFQHIASALRRLHQLDPQEKVCMILEQVDDQGNILLPNKDKKFCLLIEERSCEVIRNADGMIQHIEKEHTERQYRFLKISVGSAIAMIFAFAYYLKYLSK